MRRLKEIVILAVLLVSAVAFVLWYVAQRKSEQRAQPRAQRVVGPVLEARPFDLKIVDGKTVDLSSGKAVVSDSPEDRVAIESALKDMDAAVRDAKFDAEHPAPPPKS